LIGQRTKFGQCKVNKIYPDSFNKTKNNILSSYDPTAIGEPYANKMYTGFDWKHEVLIF